MRPRPDPVVPNQESVWRYPRPAIAEPSDRHIRIEHHGVLVADTRAAIRTLETSHPPTWYLPPADLMPGLLRQSVRRSFCEWRRWSSVKSTYFCGLRGSFIHRFVHPACTRAHDDMSPLFALRQDEAGGKRSVRFLTVDGGKLPLVREAV